MKDIARDLGVSTVTISKVLRNHPDVGEETRERVLARVKELDYRPNLAARSLVTGRTYLVGLVVPTLLHPFFAEIAKSLSDALKEKGYSLIVSSSDEDPDLEEQEIDQLLARRLDTLIIASCRSTVELFFRIERQKTPYVLVDRSLPGLAANFVGVDDEAAGVLATKLSDRYRMQENCPHSWPGNQPWQESPGRVQAGSEGGWHQGDRRLHHHVEQKGDVETRQCGGRCDGSARGCLNLGAPDGVFCFNDPLAIGAMHRSAGRTVENSRRTCGLHY